MGSEYGVYEQGAFFTRDDFDPYKTILYILGLSEKKFKPMVIERLKRREERRKDIRYLIKAFDIKPEEKTLDSICIELLSSCELSDLAANCVLDNEFVYANYYCDIVGTFYYFDDRERFEDIDDECLVMCFHIPKAWNMKDAVVPANERNAVFQLEQAAKPLLKENINWKERIGELYASGYSG